METLLHDVRYGLRTLAKRPGFALGAVLTLALGIGANTAIFSVVYAVILRPLPYPHAERIVQLSEVIPGQTHDEKDVTAAEFEFLQEHARVFESLAAYSPVGFNLSGGDLPERVDALHVSSGYFRVLGVRPILGRDFAASADRDPAERSAILSDGLWRRRFAGDPRLVGGTIALDGEAYTVIGILPSGFQVMPTGFQAVPTAEVWTTLAPVAKTIGSGQNLAVIGRLAEGVTPEQAQAQMGIVTEDFRHAFPEELSAATRLGLDPYQTMVARDVRPILLVLFGAVGFVLLIACANVANLLLGRAAARSKEIAVRTAMGASRGRLYQQMLTESVLLAVLGGVVGLAFARAGLSALLAMTPSDLPRAAEIQLDGGVLAFTFLIALLTGVLFGLAPAFQAAKTDVIDALKKGSTAGAGRRRLRSALAVSEIAVSLVLLTGAGLLMNSYRNLLRTDPGFDPGHILSMQIWLAGSKYDSTARTAEFYDQAVQRIESLPGVEAAGVVAAGLPLERGGNIGITIPGKEPHGAFGIRVVTPDYFRAMGVPLKVGRYFSATDAEDANSVAIVNESFARKEFPGENPIGRRVTIGRGTPKSSREEREIVGVVGDVKSYLDQTAQPSAFFPMAQAPYGLTKQFESWFATNIVVRAAGDPLRMRQAVEHELHAVDPTLPVGKVRSMEQVRSGAVAFQQFNMVLLSVFAGLAVILAAVGIYGVMAYTVAQRTGEIGIRVAVGAQRRDVLRLVIGDGMALALAGIALGAAGAYLLGGLLQSQLYGVRATDPATFAGVAAIEAGVALLACYVPARRAMRVNPMVALRYE